MNHNKIADRLYANLLTILSEANEADKQLAFESLDYDISQCVNDPSCVKWTRLLKPTPRGYTDDSIISFIKEYKIDHSTHNDKVAVILNRPIDETKIDEYKQELAAIMNGCVDAIMPSHNDADDVTKQRASDTLYEIDELINQEEYPFISDINDRIFRYIDDNLKTMFFNVHSDTSQLRMLKTFRRFLYGNVPDQFFAMRDDVENSGLVMFQGVVLANKRGSVVDFTQPIEVYDELLKIHPDFTREILNQPIIQPDIFEAKTMDDLVDTATILDIHQFMVEAVEKKIEGVPNKLKAAKHLYAQILEYKERHSNNNSM